MVKSLEIRVYIIILWRNRPKFSLSLHPGNGLHPLLLAWQVAVALREVSMESMHTAAEVHYGRGKRGHLVHLSCCRRRWRPQQIA